MRQNGRGNKRERTDMAPVQSNDTVATLARLLATRMQWEKEHGAEGYVRSALLHSPVHGRHSDTPQQASISKQTPVQPVAAPPQHIPPSPSIAVVSDTPSPSTPSVPPTAQIEADEAILSIDKTNRDNRAALKALRHAIGDCTRCVLHAGRTNLVFGEGDPNARLVFVGEGPGRDEDLAGRPFVGAAGQLLDRIIAAMGFSRESVYICNIIKCRPPGNRTPEPTERRICGPFVKRQLAVIKPEAVVALGATAAVYLLDTDAPISRLRGRFHVVDDLKIMPTFHPAFLLRNPSAKREVWHDMQKVMSMLDTLKEKGNP